MNSSTSPFNYLLFYIVFIHFCSCRLSSTTWGTCSTRIFHEICTVIYPCSGTTGLLACATSPTMSKYRRSSCCTMIASFAPSTKKQLIFFYIDYFWSSFTFFIDCSRNWGSLTPSWWGSTMEIMHTLLGKRCRPSCKMMRIRIVDGRLDCARSTRWIWFELFTLLIFLLIGFVLCWTAFGFLGQRRYWRAGGRRSESCIVWETLAACSVQETLWCMMNVVLCLQYIDLSRTGMFYRLIGSRISKCLVNLLSKCLVIFKTSL